MKQRYPDGLPGVRCAMCWLCGAILLSGGGRLAAAGESIGGGRADQPNIVFILMDEFSSKAKPATGVNHPVDVKAMAEHDKSRQGRPTP